MRKSRAETTDTRRMILDTASLEFRKNGIAETGLADIMGASGLTHGGFYRHFESKDRLLCESLQQAFDRLFEGVDTQVATNDRSAALEAVVNFYLNPTKRDDYRTACPLAAMSSDLRRANDQVRHIASAGIDHFLATIQMVITDLPSSEARARAIGVLSTMVGGMVLSRLVNSSEMSDRILTDARDFALQI